jgi:hypothetical protein
LDLSPNEQMFLFSWLFRLSSGTARIVSNPHIAKSAKSDERTQPQCSVDKNTRLLTMGSFAEDHFTTPEPAVADYIAWRALT